MRVLNPGGPPPDDCCDWPQLVGVGSTLRMTPRNTIVNDTEFVAADFSQYDAVTRTLALPNGWVATYEAGDFLPGGAMLVGPDPIRWTVSERSLSSLNFSVAPR